MNSVIVCGLPRSGTGTLSAVLKNNDIDCGHEGVFSINGVNMNKHHSDSSWLAAPHLKAKTTQNKFKIIIHLIRNPVLVVKSLYDVHYFDDAKNKHRNFKYIKYAYNHVPEILQYQTEIDRCVCFYLRWNEMIEYNYENYDHQIYKLEDAIDTIEIIDLVNTDKPCKNINKHKRRSTTTDIIESLGKSDMFGEFKDFCDKKGYNDEYRI